MAGFSFEEFAKGTEAPLRSETSSGFPRVSAAEQAERDAFSRRLLENEREVEAGRPSSFPATSSVIDQGEGAPAAGPAELGPKAMSFEQFAGTAARPAKPGSDPFTETRMQAAVGASLSRLKVLGGEAAALADMVLSLPGFGLKVGTQLGATTISGLQHMTSGGDRGVSFRPNKAGYSAYTAGREAAGEISELPGIRAFTNPLQRIMAMFGSGEIYETSGTVKAMNKFGELLDEAGVWAEQTSGGRVARDSVPMLVETLMYGVPGAFGKSRPAIDPVMTKALREHGVKLKREAEAESILREDTAERTAVTPVEQIARVPVQLQINEMLGIRSPQEQAQITRQRREDVRVALSGQGKARRLSPDEQMQLDLAEGRGTRFYSSPEEAAFYANERGVNEAATQGVEPEGTAYEVGSAARPERVGQAEVLRILQKPGFERTAEDLITLRKGQEGKATGDALMLLGAAGIGATVGLALSDEDLRAAALGGATGAAAALPFMGARGSVRSRMGQAGAVKEPGGMWHPEAAERLAGPLFRAFEGTYQAPQQFLDMARPLQQENNLRPQSAANIPVAEWTQRATRNYLNRYAGTSRDPLKDIEIPFGEGTKRWEEVMDQALIGRKPAAWPVTGKVDPVTGRDAINPILERFPDETVWGISGNGPRPSALTMESVSALGSHLSHVGDFLRQNVPSEKLGQYDLVRAVRETAANDARMAREMEKAQAASMKDLPVYKEYPDGFTFVELKLPEKLTAEQEKGVRRLTPQELRQWGKDGSDPTDPPIDRTSRFVAVSSDGKPVQNNYTGRPATGVTPERAWLAGELAKEGNAMGHCVGGYCEGVAAGESRIFSLRDARGRSHVTVEVEPSRYSSGEPVEVGVAQDISQIKGKQNRAPAAEYLPYVQDFVKSGKWGEVGDLEGTGLFPVNREMGSTYPNSLRGSSVNPKELGLESGFYTEAEIRKAHDAAAQRLDLPTYGELPSGPRNQQGAIDSKLLIGAGALGLGGLIGSQIGDDPITGALLGSLAGAAIGFTAGGRARFSEAVDLADYGGGRASTRIGNHSPALKLRFRELVESELVRTGNTLERLVPFMKAFSRLPSRQREEFSVAAWNSDLKGMTNVAKGDAELVGGLREALNVRRELGEELLGRGRFKTLLEDSFPRIVKDYPALAEHLEQTFGKEQRTALEAKLDTANSAAMKARGAPLTDIERSAIVNQHLQSIYRQPGGHQPGFAKRRTIQEFTKELLPFYHTLPESLFRNVKESVADLEAAKFFGRDLVESKTPGGQTYTNIDLSAGNLVGRLKAEGKLTAAGEAEILSLTESFFKNAGRAPNWFTAQARGLGHLTLLGNPLSAVMQLGDPLLAVYAQGPRAAVTAAARVLTGNKKIGVKDFYLADHISQEFLDTARGVAKGKVAQTALIGGGAAVGALLADDPLVGTAAGATAGFVSAVGMGNAVSKVFKAVGFTAIDQFGKNVHLNAALDKYSRWAQTEKGRARIAEKYQEAYGDKYPKLVEDLRRGTLSQEVRSLLFSELADMQPITRLEMSQWWMDSPNMGRLSMTLKTFMQTQIDIARRDGYAEIKKRNVAKGVKNLTSLGIMLGLAGAAPVAIQDFILGRDVKFGTGEVFENLLKTVGFSEYVRDKAEKGPIRAIGGILMPPVQSMDRIISRDPKAVQHIPVVGKLYYNWELGGNEEAELRDRKKARKEGREFELSPAAEAYVERQKEKRREKQERAREAR